MKVKNYLSIAAAIVTAGLMAGCGGGGTDTTAAADTTTYDITVERGPVLHATVMDKNGQMAQEQGNGQYRFKVQPAYPVTAYGGFIDVDRDGVVSAGDVNSTILLKAEEGVAATLVNTLAVKAEVRSWIREQFGLSDEEIDNETPSQNRKIAAISDAVYAYCIEQNITDPSSLDLTTLSDELQQAIADTIAEYEATAETTTELEESLMDELNITRITETEALTIQNTFQNTVQSQNQGESLQYAIDSLPVYDLNDTQKEVVAYMWNEEKLAKDIYMQLYTFWGEDAQLKSLYNISTRSETTHEASVQALLEKYDLDITAEDSVSTGYSAEALDAIPAGEFTNSHVQELYDTLYEMGTQSVQAALEVGCMVEVTDVEDLDADIEAAGDAEDIVMVFTFLRNGSYNHYWAFDNALKNMGVADGCCSLGTEYCKTPEEYPATNNMGGAGMNR